MSGIKIKNNLYGYIFMMDEDILKSRLGKSEIDFFGPFHALLLAFNFRYRKKYGTGFKDFQYIDMITKDFSPNSLGGEFISYFNFKSPHIFENLLGLCHELKENPITSDKGVNINLNDIILYDRRDIVLAPEDQTPENILIFALGLDSIPEKYKDPIIENSIKISDIYITNDLNIVFSSLINVIYKIRCSFFHGSLLPDEKNNKIIKHCYFILHFLLKDVIWKESQYK